MPHINASAMVPGPAFVMTQSQADMNSAMFLTKPCSTREHRGEYLARLLFCFCFVLLCLNVFFWLISSSSSCKLSSTYLDDDLERPRPGSQRPRELFVLPADDYDLVGRR